MDKNVFVISGINIVDGGALSVFYDCLDTIVDLKLYDNFNFVILVSKLEYFKKYEIIENIKFIEFPKSKKSWLNRLYYEYFYFKKLSKKIRPEIWLSMHDITPNVTANKRFVYCHNPSPFNKMSLKEAKYGMRYYLFSKLYRYLYQINIKKNDAVIVQQNWIKREFENLYKVSNVIVARPSLSIANTILSVAESDKAIFIAPSYPRYYKNFELACDAAKILVRNDINNFELFVTISGKENKYARDIVDRYSDCKAIKFIGLLPREELYELYGKSSCLIFVSKLETWGMPILEYKTTGFPMIVADLPYAHETVGDYKRVTYVGCDDAELLSVKMKEVVVSGRKALAADSQEEHNSESSDMLNGWQSLLEYIIHGNAENGL